MKSNNVYKIRQFNTFTNEFEETTFKTNSDFGKTATDSTHYKPNVNMWDSVAVGATADIGVYDFPDGKDTGDRTFQALRNPKLDRCETDKIIKDTIEQGKKDKENIKKAVIEQAKLMKEQAEEEETTTKTMTE